VSSGGATSLGHARGFSLAEVVLAIYIMLFMLIVIMSMFTLSNRPAGSNRGRIRQPSATAAS